MAPHESPHRRLNVVVTGVPNVGKSTLFNALTGLRQRVGNFPGVTVEPRVGTMSWGDVDITLIDVPGIYSLDAVSEDEILSRNVLEGKYRAIPRPDVILHVVNAASLARGLALHSSLAELGIPVVVALTMVDEVKASGGYIDDISLYHILHVPVIPVVGSRGLGINDVKAALCGNLRASEAIADIDPKDRLAWGKRIQADVVKGVLQNSMTSRFDAVLLHPVWGTVALTITLLLFFQAIFTWATPLMDGIEAGVGLLQDVASQNIAEGMLQNFVVKGLLGGVGSVIVFLPQIVILNIFIVILEESGYMARGAFLVDRFMGLFGLQGRSFIPLLGSFACAIPGIMSARIIPSYRDRIATIMAAPFMACSARLPVYALIIGAVIPASYIWGVLSLQGLVLTGLFVLGALSGLLVAMTLKKTMFRGSTLPFLMEFPPYRLPSWRNIGLTIVNKSKDFLTTAGTVILAFSIALWLLTEFPRTEAPTGASKLTQDQVQLENSYAAHIGKTIQPVFAPLGFDWKITLGVLSSYAARETFVGVMGQVYATDVQESDEGLRQVFTREIPFKTGIAILVFYVYALQCISTIAVMKRETGTWKWPAIAFGVTLVLAWGCAYVAYNVF